MLSLFVFPFSQGSLPISLCLAIAFSPVLFSVIFLLVSLCWSVLIIVPPPFLPSVPLSLPFPLLLSPFLYIRSLILLESSLSVSSSFRLSCVSSSLVLLFLLLFSYCTTSPLCLLSTCPPLLHFALLKSNMQAGPLRVGVCDLGVSLLKCIGCTPDPQVYPAKSS